MKKIYIAILVLLITASTAIAFDFGSISTDKLLNKAKDQASNMYEDSKYEKYGLTAKDGKKWEKQGVSLEDAGQCKKQDISVNEYKNWKSKIANCPEISKWKSAGFNASEGKDWINAHISFEKANGCKKVNISLYDYKGWRSFVNDCSDVTKWKTLNINSSQAGRFNRQGLTHQDVSEWRSLGINDSDINSYSKSFTTQEAREWKDIGYQLNVAKQWKANNFSPKDAQAWGKSEFNLRQATKWNNDGFSPITARRKIDKETKYKKQVAKKNKVKKEKQKQVTDKKNKALNAKWAKQGFESNEIMEWINEGITDPVLAKRYKKIIKFSYIIPVMNVLFDDKNKILTFLEKNCKSGLNLLIENPYDVDGNCHFIGGVRQQLFNQKTGYYQSDGNDFYVVSFSKSAPNGFFGIARGTGVKKGENALGQTLIIPKFKALKYKLR